MRFRVDLCGQIVGFSGFFNEIVDFDPFLNGLNVKIRAHLIIPRLQDDEKLHKESTRMSSQNMTVASFYFQN